MAQLRTKHAMTVLVPFLALKVALILTGSAVRPASAAHAVESSLSPATEIETATTPIPVAPSGSIPSDLPARVPRGERSDTLGFGYYTMISGQYYAVLNETWSFDHGASNPTEGWYAVDLRTNPSAYFQGITPAGWAGHGNQVTAPIINGAGSAWLGLMEDQADAACWISGLGYGNRWCQTLISPTIIYEGTDDYILSFKYFNNSESGYDFSRVVLHAGSQRTVLNAPGFTGVIGTPPSGPWATYSRVITNAEFGGGSNPLNFTISFEFESDGGYSDQDGLWATPYGPFGVDDVLVTNHDGTIPYFTSNFNSGLQGWTASACPAIGCEFGVAPVSNYTIQDPGYCALAGNVAEFHDANQHHPAGQHVEARSPIVNRAEQGPDYTSVRAEWDVYGDIPLANGVLFRPGWTYYPYICPATGLPQWSPRTGIPGYFQFVTPDCRHMVDQANDAGVPGNADLYRFVMEVYSSCDAFGIPPSVCTGVTNFSPVFDNIRVRLAAPGVNGLFSHAGGTSPNNLPGDPTACSSQPPNLGGVVGTSEVISTRGLNSEIANDLQLSAGQNLRMARWWGGYYNGSAGAPHVSSFTLRIYSDLGGCTPGSVLAQINVPDNAHETFVANQGEIAIYRYETCMNWVAPATGTYWFEVQADNHPFPSQWGRIAASTVTGCPSSFQSAFFGYSNWTSTNTAFGAPFDASQEFRCDYCDVAPPDSACATEEWHTVATTGPSARYAAAMTSQFDSGTTVLFGGTSGGTYYDDTWEWSGTTWATLSSNTRPSARAYDCMVYDRVRKKIVLFGGYNGAAQLGDTWEWDGANWSQVSTTGPSPRHGYAMAYDEVRGRVVLFGGSGGGLLGDTWEWDGTSWTLKTSTGPSPRQDAAMVYDCGSGIVLLYGGQDASGTLDDMWMYNGTSWMQVPYQGPLPGERSAYAMAYSFEGSFPVLYGGTGVGADATTWRFSGSDWKQTVPGAGNRAWPSMAYDHFNDHMLIFGGLDTNSQTPLGDTKLWCSPCPRVAALLDTLGNQILPDNVAPGIPAVDTDVNSSAGDVKLIQEYQQFDHRNVKWESSIPCETSLGGSVDSLYLGDTWADARDSLGLGDVSEAVVLDSLNSWKSRLLGMVQSEGPLFEDATAASGPYTEPETPYCPAPPYVFGGRDIIFIHGYRLNPIEAKMFGSDPGALIDWQPTNGAPGYLTNPAFYGSGYWKDGAERYWSQHIEHYLKSRGMTNRYLVIAWSVNQRLEQAIPSILTQIADAMRDGTGVVDLSGRRDCSKFGTPDFVIVSHSTGGPASNAAMWAAATEPKFHSQYIAAHCKAHVALAAAFTGSDEATALAGYALLHAVGPLTWECKLMRWIFGGSGPLCEQVLNQTAPLTGVTMDLIPENMQYLWGTAMWANQVRTISLAGGHATQYWPIKHILMPGLDDGVVTMNSAAANPNPARLGPGGYFRLGPFTMSGKEVVDQGLRKRDGWLRRTRQYAKDQLQDPIWLSPAFPSLYIPFMTRVATGCTDGHSSTGMVQPSHLSVTNPLWGGIINPLNRYANMYTFIESASDHYGATPGYTDPAYWPDYKPSWVFPYTFQKNNEETLAITDNTIYLDYGPTFDRAPLLRDPTDRLNLQVNEDTLGLHRKKPVIIHGKLKWRKWWIWSRVYHRLNGWETESAGDYLYDTVLKTPAGGCGPECGLPPPSGLTAWWPGDAGSGSAVTDIVAPQAPGTLAGGASIRSGWVGDCLTFYGGADHVTVPHAPKLNLSPSFTIQAWVNTDVSYGTRGIVSKYDPSTYRGYYLELRDAKPALVIEDGLASWLYASAGGWIDQRCWVLLTVTVQASGVRFFEDGLEIYSSNGAPSSGWANTKDLVIGQNYDGDIDELCFYNRVLSAAEIQAIFKKGRAGMAREFCTITPITQCLSGTTQVWGRVCNYSNSDKSYMWHIDPLAAGGSCLLNGPSVINPNAGGHLVAKGSCYTIGPIAVTCPSGASGQRSCFELHVQEEGQTNPCIHSARGAVVHGSPYWEVSTATNLGGFVAVNVGPDLTGTVSTSFEGRNYNPGLTPQTLQYTIRVEPADGDTTGMPAFQVNGSPPGMPTYGSITVPSGTSAPIPANIDVTGSLGGRFYNLILGYDLDGDEQFDDAASLVLGDPLDLDPAGVEAELKPAEPFLWIRTQPNPFTDHLEIEFSLKSGGEALITVYDIAGRRVRDLANRNLRPGLQSIMWDGLDQEGRPTSRGMYFVEVRAEDRTFRHKVLVMRGR